MVRRLCFPVMDPPFSTPSTQPWPLLVENLRTYAVFTLDANGVIESWNQGVRELFGYEEHEFVGQPGSMIFTLEDRTRPRRAGGGTRGGARAG